MDAPVSRHAPERVLVTGGAGFIGSNYLRWMIPRHTDVRFVNLDLLTYAGNRDNLRDGIENAPDYRFVQGDIVDGDLVRRLFEEERFTTVVHFAAESHVDLSIVDPLGFVRTNVVGTAVLLDAARRAWKEAPQGDDRYRFHHVSTDEVFGSLGPEGAFREETPYDPRSPYSASKAAADHLVRAYAHTFGLPVVITNCSNNYGPFQYPEKLIPVALLAAKEKREIPVYGRGENVRDWLYVEDHCEALERVLLQGVSGRTYAIGGRSERRNLDLARTIADFVDAELGRTPGTARNLIRFVADRPGHDHRYAIDCARAERELGWRPRRTLEQGLRETVRWYLRNDAWVEGIRRRKEKGLLK